MKSFEIGELIDLEISRCSRNDTKGHTLGLVIVARVVVGQRVSRI